MGTLFFQQGKLEEALMYFKKALMYFKEFDDDKTASTFLKIAETYTELQDYDKAEENFIKSKKIYSKYKDLIGEGYALTGLGIIQEKKEDYDEARKYYNKALKTFRKANDAEREGIVISLIASTYQFQGAWEDALMEYEKSSQIFEDIGDSQRETYIHDMAQEVVKKRSQVTVSRKEWVYAFIYLVLLVIAEVSTTYFNLQLGLFLMSAILFSLLLHSSLNVSHNFSVLLRSMMALPIIRIVGLSIPLMQVQALYWFPIIAIPLFAASYTIMRSQGLSRENIGLIMGNIPIQFLIAITGLFLGVIEYWILHPKPLIAEFTFLSVFIAGLILIVSTGLAEELLFRGIIQKNAENVFGKLLGLLYVALLFTTMHIGWQNFYDFLFVFAVAIFYGYAFQRTRSLVGITLSHGLSNTVLFLIMPFLAFSF